MGRWLTHRAEFAMPHECVGQWWTEAIAVLSVASAEIRLEAARMSREISPGSQYGHDGGFSGTSPSGDYRNLMNRAERLDELAHWLRDRTELPTGEDVARAAISEAEGR